MVSSDGYKVTLWQFNLSYLLYIEESVLTKLGKKTTLASTRATSPGQHLCVHVVNVGYREFSICAIERNNCALSYKCAKAFPYSLEIIFSI